MVACDEQVKNIIINTFNQMFRESERTVLVDSGSEPLYLPASENGSNYHQIYFANGFWNSALHEIAHWCVAGEARRRLIDYGYWYKPDGRNHLEQQEFEFVEAKPQALEWIFTSAVARPFFLSSDNLSGSSLGPSLRFKKNVHDQAVRMVIESPPPRAAKFLDGLMTVFESKEEFNSHWNKVIKENLHPN